MTEVTVDLSDMRRVQRKAKRQFARHAEVMLGFAQRAAETEKRTKRYQDHTPDGLRFSTLAEITMDAPDLKGVLLTMARFYASFVNRRGFSNIDRLALRAAIGILKRFFREAERLD